MKFRILSLSVVALAATVGAFAFFAKAWTNGQPASSVLGQPGFTTSTGGGGATAVNSAPGVAIDPATNKIFVVDGLNSRVLRFPANVGMGGAAEAVFGQATVTTPGGCGTAINRLCSPQSIAIDSAGRLWVADFGNHRVIRYDSAATAASGINASQVLGQTDFVTGTGGLSATKLLNPQGIWADGTRIWVADRGNSRVLRFEDAANKGNGAAADGVLGQPNFTSSSGAVTQTGMNQPISVTVDRGGRLWVADFNNSRVLRFDAPATKPNGGAADGVLGQVNFTSNVTGTSASLFTFPSGVSADVGNRLYVSDNTNNRVLVFYNAHLLANGAPATNVLGQPDFTTSTSATTQSKMNTPAQVAASPNNPDLLFVADNGNRRVLIYIANAVTAADVTVSGRVTNNAGFGVRGATVAFVGSDGTRYSAISNAFGYYSIANVPSGETYMANVASRGLVFVPRAVTVTDSLTGVDFAAQ